MENQIYCCPTVVPPVIVTPITINTLNCDGTTTPQLMIPPQQVQIIQTKPFVICTNNDTESIVVDGYMLIIGVSSVINQTFSSPVSNISIHNNTQDFISVSISPVPLGNNILIIAPNSTQNFGSLHLNKITDLTISHLNITGFGGGTIIVNGFSI